MNSFHTFSWQYSAFFSHLTNYTDVIFLLILPNEIRSILPRFSFISLAHHFNSKVVVNTFIKFCDNCVSVINFRESSWWYLFCMLKTWRHHFKRKVSVTWMKLGAEREWWIRNLAFIWQLGKTNKTCNCGNQYYN